MTRPTPYRSTPIFTNETLPEALRRVHSTKAGVWGLLKVLKGTVVYIFEESCERQVVHAGDAIIILPQQLHSVEPADDMEMQVEFYQEPPHPFSN